MKIQQIKKVNVTSTYIKDNRIVSFGLMSFDLNFPD